ncbi:MAG: ShlB/FhaC/HecB family hemolysin secretion/activation protein [Methylococcales bacterium]
MFKCAWLFVAAFLAFIGFNTKVLAVDITPPVDNDSMRPSQRQLSPMPFRPQQQDNKFILPPVPKPSQRIAGTDKLILEGVEFSGNTAVTSVELQEIAKPFLNHPLRGTDLEELRQQLTLRYVRAGFINSGAVIPNQSADQGVLHINIVEGSLSEVIQHGQGRLHEYYLRDRLLLGAGSPLNIKNLQDSYQVLLKDPLLERLNARLLPGARPGESMLDLKVTRARPYQLYLGADNYATPSVGGFIGRIGGWVSNLSTLGETIDASMALADGLIGFNTGLELPVNAYDTRLTFRYSDTYTQLVEKPLDEFRIKTHVIGYEGGISQPLYRSLAHEFKVGASFTVRKDNSTIAGVADPLTPGVNSDGTQVSALRLWQQYHYQGNDNVLGLRSTFSQGLDVFGATIQANTLPGSDFFSWLGQAQYAHRVMDNGARLVWRGAMQLADAPLLGLERFAVGGFYSVRGYRENIFVRDNGFYTGMEFRYPLFGGESTARHSLYLIPFMDYGGAWNNAGTDVFNNTDKNYLHSVGIGLNWHFHQVDTEFYWAHAVNPQSLTVAGQQRVPLQHNIQDDGLHFKVNLNVF